eukprot:TRINITY_DN103422_c0_g1_i1.p1 TRINITY_DN103422_c0_g1~~TRINITY_DN103422_c0_g1_i1.p1  ORF type:complete len:467 (-),score=50.67 TRINITY_DN103422_c0_g1_i1:96-1496(-)
MLRYGKQPAGPAAASWQQPLRFKACGQQYACSQHHGNAGFVVKQPATVPWHQHPCSTSLGRQCIEFRPGRSYHHGNIGLAVMLSMAAVASHLRPGTPRQRRLVRFAWATRRCNARFPCEKIVRIRDRLVRSRTKLSSVAQLWEKPKSEHAQVFKRHQDDQPERAAAFGSLLLVASLWGTVGPSSRLLFSMVHAPSSCLAVALANIAAFMFLAGRSVMAKGIAGLSAQRSDKIAGIETGCWYYLAVLLICAGLERTSATHEAFIAQLCTLIVPCLQALQGVPVPRNVCFACVMAFAGCMVLGLASSGGSSSVSLEGDLLCFCSAVAFALHNIRLDAYARRGDVELIAVWSKATQAVIGILFLQAATLLGWCGSSLKFFGSASAMELGMLLLWVLWNGFIVKGVAAIWHAAAYKVVSASEAEITLATTPLWAFTLAVIFLAEPVTLATFIGAALFVGAMVLAAKSEKQ